MIDKQILKTRFEANYDTYDLFATVQDSICCQICDQLQMMNLAPKNILEIGAGTGLLTKRLVKLFKSAEFTINDLSDRSAQFVRQYFDTEVTILTGDAEQLNLGGNYDLITSSSAVQWFSNLERFFTIVKSSLSTEGIFAFSTFGPQNFTEIKQLTGSGLDYPSFDKLKQMLKSIGFELLYTCEYSHTMHFNKPIEVLKHINATGVNALHKQIWTPGKLHQFPNDYIYRFSDKNGSVKLTYHPIIFFCKNNFSTL
jgi:malonyl-ACP O-methyltransferase BioC